MRSCSVIVEVCGSVTLSLVYASCSVTTQSWMSSLVSASCITTQSCRILNFPLLVPSSSWSQYQLVTCSQFQLVVRLYDLIVTFSCSHFVHTFDRENTSFEVWYLHTGGSQEEAVGSSRAPQPDKPNTYKSNAQLPQPKKKVRRLKGGVRPSGFKV